MRNLIFILVISLFGLTSCNSDDDFSPKETYELQEIKWRVTENEGVMGQSMVEFGEETIVNNTDQRKAFEYEPIINKKWCSKIQFKDSKALEEYKKVKLDSIFVPTEGISILSKEYSEYFGGEKVPFKQGCSQVPYSINFKDSYQVLPQTKLQVKSKMKLENIKASFLATFVHTKTNELIHLEGTWEGVFLSEINVEAKISDIK